MMLSQFIQAFAILIKYGDAEVRVDSMGSSLEIMVEPSRVSLEDRDTLSRLGFVADACDDEYFFGFVDTPGY